MPNRTILFVGHANPEDNAFTQWLALSLARQRLITARFPYYKLRALTPEDKQLNPDGAWLADSGTPTSDKKTFQCKTVPHITLGSISRNTALDPIVEKHQPILSDRLKALNAALKSIST